MEETNSTEVSFFRRVGLAFKVLVDGAFAKAADATVKHLSAPTEAARAVPPERVHASALALLASLQREGRLVDFLQQEVTGFSDEEVGAAARVVHTGCRKTLVQYLTLEPVLNDAEGSTVTVPPGFDAQRIRLSGNVAGQPPFRGTLKHHGWAVQSLRFPAIAEALDPKVVAPAEVELS